MIGRNRKIKYGTDKISHRKIKSGGFYCGEVV